MQKELIIELAHLPEEGKEFAGELDQALFDLPKNDAQPVGALEYQLYVQRFDNEVLLRGYLAAPFEFVCVRTNQKFIKTIQLEEVAMAIEITEGQINATEAMREEIVINFPAYPRCDEGDEAMECEIEEKYLALDKVGANELERPPLDKSEAEIDQSGDNRWDALDALDDLKDNN